MELRQLELFVAVAEERHFTRAAIRCHVGQSVLSNVIRSLEHDLGESLFARSTRRVDLTNAGLALLPQARRTIAAASAARTAVREVGAILRGSLAVGGITTTGTLDQMAALASFRELHPGVDIRYVTSFSGPLLDDVRLGRLDAALVTLPAHIPRGIHATGLVTESLMFVCRPDHRLAAHAFVTLDDVADEDFVGSPPGTVGGDRLREIFGAAKAQPDIPFRVNDLATMLEFISKGLGVSLVPESVARSRADLQAIALVDPTITWRLGIITPPIDDLSPAARSFVQIVCAEAALSVGSRTPTD